MVDRYPRVVKFRFLSLKQLSPVFTLVVFGFAVWAIVLELRHYSFSKIVDSVVGIEPTRIIFALALIGPGLLALACYDLVAARFFQLGIGWWRPLATGLLSYSITNTTGHGVIVGAMLRLRIYPRWGVTGKQVGEVVGFSVLTYYLGLSLVSGSALVLEGAELTRLLSQLPKVGYIFAHEWFRYVVPSIFLGGVVLWFVLISVRRKPIVIRSHEFRLPTPLVGLLQILASIGDLAIAASVLYVLLPSHHGIAWIAFVGIFSVVQFASLMSLVPGGIGVFTAIMLVVLGPRFESAPELIAALIAFRVLYYLLPFAIGGLTFLGIVTSQNARDRKRRAREGGTNTPETAA